MYVSVTMAWWDRWCICLWNEMHFSGSQTPRVLQKCAWALVQTTTDEKGNRVKHVSYNKTSIVMRNNLHFSSLISFVFADRASSFSLSACAFASCASSALVSSCAFASRARRASVSNSVGIWDTISQGKLRTWKHYAAGPKALPFWRMMASPSCSVSA